MPADDDGRVRHETAYLFRERENLVGFERVHARDPDDTRTRTTDRRSHRRAEAQIDEGRLMAACGERRGNVFEPERLYTKKRSESEAVIFRDRTQQQDVHALSSRGYHRTLA